MNKILLILALLCGIAAADGSGAAPAAAPDPQLEAYKTSCTAAMNDPKYAESLALIIDKRLDQKTIDAHKDALYHIQKNEDHVIYAYAAMWVIAALLVAFLFLRQQALKTEIAALRRDLKHVEDKA
jgi:hypothetical protein